MSPGKLVDAQQARPYRAPAAEGATLEEERRVVEDAFEQARREGFQKGLSEGRAAGEKEAGAERARLARSLEALAEQEVALFEGVRGALLELAAAIASRVVRARVAADDETVARVFEELVPLLSKGAPRRVRCHPDDREALLLLSKKLASEGPMELVEDPGMERGGVLVECRGEELDARISTAIEACREALEAEEGPR